MRRLIQTAGLIIVVALMFSALQAGAQSYPTQNIKLIIPFGAGGPNDLVGRPLAQKVSEAIGQTIVIENRPGANGIIGTNAVAKSAPDGYTMLQTTGSFTANPSMVKNMPYDPLSDLAPITQIAESYGLLLMVPTNSPIKSLADLVERAKKEPGKLNYAITGFGNITHVTVEFFKKLADIELVPVPYKGTADSITAMLSGQVDLSIVSTTAGAPHIASGQLRALGLTGAERAPNLPDVPTFQELGYKEMDLKGYYGWWFPAGTPRERIDLMQHEVKQALESPEMQEVLKKSGLAMRATTPNEFREFLAKDLAFQASIIKRIGIEPR
ncbi:MAG TPA: tripartite tricarboxylate transporter substrate binding protein [Xanthobacteraceae bacterium]|nr:tripartite tricarboxylate transporter substrate binding protein [Xanthobacteraceae bacterium]